MALVESKPPAPSRGRSSFPRETEALRLLAAGRSNQQIADDLVISLNTANRHVSNIYAKTGAANRAEAVSYAHRRGSPASKYCPAARFGITGACYRTGSKRRRSARLQCAEDASFERWLALPAA